jgi:flagellar motor switch protein FliN
VATQSEGSGIGAGVLGAFADAANAMALSLSEAVGRPVAVGGPAARRVDASALAGEILEGACGVTLDMSGVSGGVGMWIFDSGIGRSLAGLLAGDAEPDPNSDLDAGRAAKLAEIGTAIGAALAGTLGEALGKSELAFAATDPKPALGALAGDVAKGEVLCVTFPFSVGDAVSGAGHLVAAGGLLDELGRALGGPGPVAGPAAEPAAPGTVEDSDLEPAELPPAGTIGPAEGALAAAQAAEIPAVETASFAPFSVPVGGPAGATSGLDLILDVPLEVSVELGRTRMLIKDILDLAAGSIIELEAVAGEAVDVIVNGKLVAKGEVVVIEDNFGVRITEIVAPIEKATGM